MMFPTHLLRLRIAFRIPGTWAHPGELVQRMPAGCQLSPEGLTLPDECESTSPRCRLTASSPESSKGPCRRPPTAEELEQVNRYTVNIVTARPRRFGRAARTMMRARSCDHAGRWSRNFH